MSDKNEKSFYESLLDEKNKEENSDAENPGDGYVNQNSADEKASLKNGNKVSDRNEGKSCRNGKKKSGISAELRSKPLTKRELKQKRTSALQIFLTVLKSLMSLISLCICFVIFVFLNESLFGIYLFLYIIILAIGSYLLSAACLLINVMYSRLFGKWWNITSLASILVMILAIAISELCEIEGFTYVFCVILTLQAVPTVLEVYTFEKYLSRRRMLKAQK